MLPRKKEMGVERESHNLEFFQVKVLGDYIESSKAGVRSTCVLLTDLL